MEAFAYAEASSYAYADSAGDSTYSASETTYSDALLYSADFEWNAFSFSSSSLPITLSKEYSFSADSLLADDDTSA